MLHPTCRPLLVFASLATFASAQTPPPLHFQFQDGTIGSRVEINATIVDGNGNPWSGCVLTTLQVRDYYSTSVRADTDILGNLNLFTYVPIEDGGSQVQVAFWANPTSVAERGIDGPFLTGAEGLSAQFPFAVLAGDDMNGFTLDFDFAQMSEPPHVASVNLSPASLAGQEIGIADGNLNRWSGGMVASMRNVIQLTSGISSIPIYSWGAASFWDFEMKTPVGFFLGGDSVRRGDFNYIYNVPPEVLVDVDVDPTTYPNAQMAILVRQADHLPNPAVPSGSDSDSFKQLTKKLRAGAPLVLRTSGLLSCRMNAVETDCVLEIWGWDLAVTGNQAFLLASQPVGAAAGHFTFNF